jgi:hypothetical protein
VSWPHKDGWRRRNRQPAEQNQILAGHRIHQKLVVLNHMDEFPFLFFAAFKEPRRHGFPPI